jgi:cytochrome c oxidase cbb3-type subunit I/II
MIRPVRFETVRYGEYSKAGESVYNHPFLWGSKRTGPDLAREGGKRGDDWHYKHMKVPKDMSPGSLMPAYPWMMTDDLDISLTKKKISAMRTLGVPYEEGYEEKAMSDLEVQALKIATSIVTKIKGDDTKEEQDATIETVKTKEIVALIAYLQRLGQDINVEEIE